MSTTMTDTVPAALAAVAALADRALAATLASAELPENLRAAAEYAVLGGGKRLRPVLALLASEAVCGRREPGFSSAVGLELIHCFSLVHDDLPAMDDDDLRRGRPALHRHAGEAMAILAGDVMVSLAIETLATDESLPPRHRLLLVRELSAATTAMIAGQVYDTLGGFTEELTDEQRLHLIHRCKTAALLRGACRMGAIAGGADEAVLALLTTYGDAIGLMFQIVDDLLDVTQSTEHLGKASGKDQEAGKLTFPGLIGIDESRQRVTELAAEAASALAPLGDAAAPLAELAEFLAVRTR